jgi:probable F420-dependent oxidoreductase
MAWSRHLGAVGVWRGVNDLDPAMAETIEELGFGTIWQGGSPGSDLRAAEELLAGTESLHLATGIVNIWNSDPAELADSYHRIEARYPGGCCSASGPVTVRRPRSGYARLMRWPGTLDVLDEHAVPQPARVLAALGPRMLELAAARSAGTHPYLTVPSQSGKPDDSGTGRTCCSRADGRVRYRPRFGSACRPQLSATAT